MKALKFSPGIVALGLLLPPLPPLPPLLPLPPMPPLPKNPFRGPEKVLYEQAIPAAPYQMIVPVKFDGTIIPLVLDTGCYWHALDSSMRAHFATPKSLATMSQSGASVETTIYEAPPMAVGTWKLPPGNLFETSFALFQKGLGVGTKGILGLAALKDLGIEVNFDHAKLRLIQNYKAPKSASHYQSGSVSEGWQSLPVKLPRAGGLAQIKVAIDGIGFDAAIDTGSSSTVTLQESLFSKLVASGAIAQEAESSDGETATLLGMLKSRRGKFTRGNLLGVNLRGMPVDADLDVNLLGMPFLMNFNFVYDVYFDRFYFERRHVEPPIDYHMMLGAILYFWNDHGNVLREPQPGGPAATAGIRKDDAISRLGPLQSGQLNAYSVYDLCENYAGKTIDVEYSRPGQSQTIKTSLKLREKQFLYPPSH